MGTTIAQRKAAEPAQDSERLEASGQTATSVADAAGAMNAPPLSHPGSREPTANFGTASSLRTSDFIGTAP